jgi:tRNA pseudouridine55 synthase
VNKPRSAPRRRVDGVLLLDKPSGITSNAALQKVRWLFNAAKAGHTGTLDPMATGLLPLCFGEATKFSGALLDADKTYHATVRLGIVTDTADAEGKVLETRPVHVIESEVRVTLSHFIGVIEQVPPMYSALKRDGTPLYELARQGIEVERTPRQVTIHSLEMTAWRGDEFDLTVSCSKGTYVRTLAADIGATLGSGAHLSALRRTLVGSLDIADAVALDVIEMLPVEGRNRLLQPTDALLAGLPVVQVSEQETARILHGQPIRRVALPEQSCRLYSGETFIGLAVRSADGYLRPQRLIAAKEDQQQ